MKRRTMFHVLLGTIVAVSAVCTSSINTAASESVCYLNDNQIDICFDAQEKYGISAALIASIIQAESSGNKKATNGNCRGLMQVSDIHGYENIYDERQNVYAGCEVLTRCIDRADGELGLALMYYNGVSNASAKYDTWLSKGDFNTYPTSYVEKVVKTSMDIEREWYE